MLATLKVRDLVLIEDISLDFAPGLNVLTGETGAGKSILLDALGLAAGNRAGARSSVRGEAAQGSAVAIFELACRQSGLRRACRQRHPERSRNHPAPRRDGGWPHPRLRQ